MRWILSSDPLTFCQRNKCSRIEPSTLVLLAGHVHFHTSAGLMLAGVVFVLKSILTHFQSEDKFGLGAGTVVREGSGSLEDRVS